MEKKKKKGKYKVFLSVSVPSPFSDLPGHRPHPRLLLLWVKQSNVCSPEKGCLALWGPVAAGMTVSDSLRPSTSEFGCHRGPLHLFFLQ